MGREPDPLPEVSLAWSGPSKLARSDISRFSGAPDGIKADVARVKEIIKPCKPTSTFYARNKQEEADLWSARKEALWTMTSIKPEGYNIWSTDVAVPISRLAEIIGRLSAGG